MQSPRSYGKILSKAFSNIYLKRRKVYVCGIQPTGVPHIGNYLGFIQNFVKLQEEAEAERYLFIADLHSIAVGFMSPKTMRKNITEMAAALIACGVDPDSTVFFQQSRIAEHAELAWILGAFQTVPALQRLPQYKDKSQRFRQGAVPLGLLCYPLLQAADVLLYRATHIPVGEDQNQHVNIVRDMAQAFQNTFQTDFFPVPEKMFSNTPRVRSLHNPMKKMSKSDPREGSRILISDSSEIIFSKCKRATSDSNSQLFFDVIERPAISNLITLNAYFSGRTVDEVVHAARNLDTVAFKRDLHAVIDAKLAPIREKFLDLCGREVYIKEILEKGNDKARRIATENLAQVKEFIGFF